MIEQCQMNKEQEYVYLYPFLVVPLRSLSFTTWSNTSMETLE